jgi:hypothetical protein
MLRDSDLTWATNNILEGIAGGHDSRLLPRELLANARMFDVGCNEGLTWTVRTAYERL